MIHTVCVYMCVYIDIHRETERVYVYMKVLSLYRYICRYYKYTMCMHMQADVHINTLSYITYIYTYIAFA